MTPEREEQKEKPGASVTRLLANSINLPRAAYPSNVTRAP